MPCSASHSWPSLQPWREEKRSNVPFQAQKLKHGPLSSLAFWKRAAKLPSLCLQFPSALLFLFSQNLMKSFYPFQIPVLFPTVHLTFCLSFFLLSPFFPFSWPRSPLILTLCNSGWTFQVGTASLEDGGGSAIQREREGGKKPAWPRRQITLHLRLHYLKAFPFKYTYIGIY